MGYHSKTAEWAHILFIRLSAWHSSTLLFGESWRHHFWLNLNLLIFRWIQISRVRSLGSLEVVIENSIQVGRHTVDMLLPRLSLAGNVSRTNMALLRKHNSVLLWRFPSLLFVYRLILGHDPLAHWMQGLFIGSIRRIRPRKKGRSTSLILLHLLEYFLAEFHIAYLLASFSPSKDLVHVTVDLHIVSGQWLFELVEGQLAILILFDSIADGLFRWRFKWAFIASLLFFPIPCERIIVLAHVRLQHALALGSTKLESPLHISQLEIGRVRVLAEDLPEFRCWPHSQLLWKKSKFKKLTFDLHFKRLAQNLSSRCAPCQIFCTLF